MIARTIFATLLVVSRVGSSLRAVAETVRVDLAAVAEPQLDLELADAQKMPMKLLQQL